jgi:hypothetical protein
LFFIEVSASLHEVLLLYEIGLNSFLAVALRLGIEEWNLPGEVEVFEHLLGALLVSKDFDEYFYLAFSRILFHDQT